MIYISLPNFYLNFQINEGIYKSSILHPEWFKIPITFNMNTGNFPYCYWNGGYNNNIGKGGLYQDFANCFIKSELPIRFNCSNINLTKDDYSNTMANLILKLNENGSNLVELHDLDLYEYINNKYPEYNFVFSKEAIYKYDVTAEFINKLIDSQCFKYIGIPETKVKDLEFLNQISNKKILILTLVPVCNINCNNYTSCKIEAHRLQYDYYSTNKFTSCPHKQDYLNNSLISYDDIVEIYLPMGISHFDLCETLNGFDIVNYINETFILPEYQLAFYKTFNKEV